jgi:hypothetical protein
VRIVALFGSSPLALILAACEGAAPVPVPREPVSAFTPRPAQGCSADYAPRGTVCVHRAYTVDDILLTRQIADYERGARAPMVPATPEPASKRSPTDLPPGALSTDTPPDPAEAHARRLAALDAMLARLRAREAAAAPQPRASAQEGSPGTAAARTTGGAASEGAQGGGLAGKLAELRHLVQRLPAEDTADLSKQLRRDGFTDDELRGLVPTAR